MSPPQHAHSVRPRTQEWEKAAHPASWARGVWIRQIQPRNIFKLMLMPRAPHTGNLVFSRFLESVNTNYFLDIISLLSNLMQNVLILHSETTVQSTNQMKVNIQFCNSSLADSTILPKFLMPLVKYKIIYSHCSTVLSKLWILLSIKHILAYIIKPQFQTAVKQQLLISVCCCCWDKFTYCKIHHFNVYNLMIFSRVTRCATITI